MEYSKVRKHTRKLTSAKSSARDMVGDGKLPNKYWVSASNDYYIYSDESGAYEWVGDVMPKFKSKSEGTWGAFSTYAQAKEKADSLNIDGKRIARITIEDRLSGEIYQASYYVRLPDKSSLEVHEDLGFTKEKIQQAGYKFE